MFDRFARIVVITVAALTLGSVRAAAAADPAPADPPVHKNVDAMEFERLTKEPNVVVLDVRTPAEYAAGHLKDARLMNVNDKAFADQIAKLDKGKTYLVYCAAGARSTKACNKLDALGMSKVYNLTGGIKAWENAHKPVEK
jgi:rhodanese-related sulfurtransferase